MRASIVVLCLALATSAFAQPRAACPGGSPAERYAAQFTQVEDQLRQRAAGVKRDAFIVAQLVQATAELSDFQKNVAIQKALDRVMKATQKANERPVAGMKTQEMLQSIKDDLEHARLKAGIADMAALKRQVLQRTHFPPAGPLSRHRLRAHRPRESDRAAEQDESREQRDRGVGERSAQLDARIFPGGRAVRTRSAK